MVTNMVFIFNITCIIVTDITELSRYSKNYLPILFNLYTNEPVEGELSRDPILDCIKSFLSITDQQVCQIIFCVTYHNIS